MEPALNPFQPMLQATLDRRLSEGQPLLEDGDQRLHRRPAVDTNHVEVHAVGTLEVSSSKQVAHHPVEINAVGPGHQYQARGVLMVRLVAQIRHHRQFAGLHLRCDLLQHLGARNLVRQRMNHDRAIFDRVGGPDS